LARAARETAALKKKTGKTPCLAIISVGEDAASKIYLRKKREACAFCGVRHLLVELPAKITQEELLQAIGKMNAAPGVNGLIVQVPLPLQLNANEAVAAVSLEKDVDGFTPANVGRLFAGDARAFVPATVKGVMRLLAAAKVKVVGADVVVIGKGNIAGKPIALLLANAGATVTMCDKYTRNLAEKTRKADVLVSATGAARLVTKNFVKRGAVVIDVGITRLPDGKIVGDVAFDEVSKALGGKGALTPVPGGVGPMTVAMLIENTLEAFKRQNGIA
ncbi:MAG: bifunctional 5,10-methylenetetrahydrofolate dehydrogenase/5,10-methenyltetrahydrofolate cyclohydrolase, partial [Candidatus Micrarchaeota archaeon]